MKHLACIMDGNRRWGRQHLFDPLAGHQKGVDAAQLVIDFCLEKAIPHLSLYTLSIENLTRSARELDFLFSLCADSAHKFLKENDKKGVAIRFVGDRQLFPERLKGVIEEVEQQSLAGDRLQLNLLFCYGAQQEMLSAIKTLLHKQLEGSLVSQQLTLADIEQALWLSHAPPPDLIIRTGKVKRLSNFLLFQAAYAELYFLDCLWPELTRVHLDDALNFFYQSQRNFGK